MQIRLYLHLSMPAVSNSISFYSTPLHSSRLVVRHLVFLKTFSTGLSTREVPRLDRFYMSLN
ncbi:hypothetical protein [Escherichia phage FL23]